MEEKSIKEQRLDEYNKKLGIILKKYPNVYADGVPKSIVEEYQALNGIVNALKVPKTWGKTEVEPGLEVDQFILDRYKEAKETLDSLGDTNSQYFTKEDEERYENDSKIDFDTLTARIDGIKDLSEASEISRIFQNPQNQYLPMETQRKLKELEDKCAVKYSEMKKASLEESKSNLPIEKPQKGSFWSKVQEKWETIKSKIGKMFQKKQNVNEKNQEELKKEPKKESIKVTYRVLPENLIKTNIKDREDEKNPQIENPPQKDNGYEIGGE